MAFARNKGLPIVRAVYALWRDFNTGARAAWARLAIGPVGVV